jgi:hypothetical protein
MDATDIQECTKADFQAHESAPDIETTSKKAHEQNCSGRSSASPPLATYPRVGRNSTRAGSRQMEVKAEFILKTKLSQQRHKQKEKEVRRGSEVL